MEDPDELDEDNDWETQQIRKAVTGSQLAAAQQESCMSMYNNSVPHPTVIQEQTIIPGILTNQKARFQESYVPQRVLAPMIPDDVVNKTKEMYIYLVS